MATLERAIAIAREAHKGQVDKASADYVEHPLRVMARVQGEDAKIVAVLHDVVEDCPDWPLDRLRAEGFSAEVLAGIDSVTKREGESYGDFVARAGRDPLGRQVKFADLADNSDVSRLGTVTPTDMGRLEKYARAMKALE